MQTAVPETLQLEKETEATRQLYGLDQPATRPFGKLCLAARRLVERGVRFVQVFHGGGGGGAWDAHAGIKANHGKLSAAGRPADRRAAQGPEAARPARRHAGRLGHRVRPLAGRRGRRPRPPPAGLLRLAGRRRRSRAGSPHGATDEIGFHAVEDRHYVTDIHATVLHQLGLDPRRLEVPGRKRLEIDFGKPIEEIIA